MFSLVLRSRIFPTQSKVVSSLKSLFFPTDASLNLCINQGKKTLYTAYALGLEGFQIQGEQIRQEVPDVNTFTQKMASLLESPNKDQMVFSEDLKKIVALCQKDENYLDLVISLTKRYNSQVHELNLKPYSFGPQIMRLFYIHDYDDSALEVLLNEEFGNFFHQASSYQIVMDLLYKKGRYEDVIKLVDNILARDLFPLPTSCFTLAVAANYKKNNLEALEHSLSLMRNAVDIKRKIPIRTIGFVSGLALNTGKYEIALETISYSHSPPSSHFILNNLNVLAKAHLNHLEDVNEVLRIRALVDSPKSSKSSSHLVLCSDTLERLQAIMDQSLDGDIVDEFRNLCESLKNMNLISSEKLDDVISDNLADHPNKHSSRSHFTRRNSFRSQKLNR